MSHADFVHLRTHSAYSLSEGAIRVEDLVKLCQEARMPAVAVTDTNNLFGALEFSGAAAGSGVQPIIGAQLSVRLDGAGDGDSHLAKAPSVVLLARDETGYLNLLELLREAFLGDEERIDPEVPLETLLARNEGLILLTGGVEGPIGRLLLKGDAAGAETLTRELFGAYGGRLYIEIQRHGVPAEARTEPAFIKFAYDLDIPLVATNEPFFSSADMYEAHDALICISEGAYLSQDNRRRLTPEHWFKGADEMRALFRDLPEAVDNTLVIAKRCAFMVEKTVPILPPYNCGEGRNEADELRAQSEEGLETRLEAAVYTAAMDEEARKEAAKPYRERLDVELGIITGMGFPGYFLIVADFIAWSKNQGIPVGPGRGSGAGSVVAWALTITDLDPLRFGLLFERFLNPERVSMPDFDIDFCQDRRDEVIRYVQRKYGHDHVAQIITFGKLQARAVLRDVGRVLQMPYGQVDRISKMVPNNPANPVTLKEALDGEPQLRRMVQDDPEVRRLVDLALKLEGLYRHASTHAAGVVIGDRPLEKLIPLYRDPRSDMPVTGFNMKSIESAGLVKFDFLGLKTLTVLSAAIEHCREKGVEIDLANLPLDDALTFEMIGRGETTGVFQLESQGMRDVLKNMRADAFEDIIAIVALYRPGPMDNIPTYIARKHGKEDPDYMHPALEPYLKETFGIMIYQEQVMQAARALSGYTLGEADLLRRAMGKKIKEEMDKQREVFVQGAVEREVDKAQASHIFDQVAKFAGYGFNKSHAAAYALVAYQTAYLKANHPVEFLAASMTLDLHNTDKLAAFKNEAKRLGVQVLPPDVNRSGAAFRVERDGPDLKDGQPAIRYALGAVKNVGTGAMEALVGEREKKGAFKDLADFAGRLDPKSINKRLLENLIRAGALDGLNPNRRQLFEGADKVISEAQSAHQARTSDQMGLFGGGGGEDVRVHEVRLPSVPDWPGMEKLNKELDAVGFYLSAHPLEAYESTLKKMRVASFTEIETSGATGAYRLAGTYQTRRELTSQKGSRFAFISFSSPGGDFEATAFSEVLSTHRDEMENGKSFVVDVMAEIFNDQLRLTIQRLESLEMATADAVSGVEILLDSADPVTPLKQILEQQGGGRVRVHLVPRIADDQEVVLTLPERYAVSPQVIMAFRSLPGIHAVEEL